MQYDRQQILDMLSRAIPVMDNEDLAYVLNYVNACICEDFESNKMRVENEGFTDDPLPPSTLSPFDQGEADYWLHLSVESCPHSAGTPEYRQWYEGWVWAQQDDEMCLDDLMFSTDGTE